MGRYFATGPTLGFILVQYHANAPEVRANLLQNCSRLRQVLVLSDLSASAHYGTLIAIHDLLNLATLGDGCRDRFSLGALRVKIFYTISSITIVARAMTLEESHVRADSEFDQRK